MFINLGLWPLVPLGVAGVVWIFLGIRWVFRRIVFRNNHREIKKTDLEKFNEEAWAWMNGGQK